jgi:hypothetical protein
VHVVEPATADMIRGVEIVLPILDGRSRTLIKKGISSGKLLSSGREVLVLGWDSSKSVLVNPCFQNLSLPFDFFNHTG